MEGRPPGLAVEARVSSSFSDFIPVVCRQSLASAGRASVFVQLYFLSVLRLAMAGLFTRIFSGGGAAQDDAADEVAEEVPVAPPAKVATRAGPTLPCAPRRLTPARSQAPASRGPNITDAEKVLLIEGKVAECIALHVSIVTANKHWRDTIGGKTASEAEKADAISKYALARVGKWAETHKPKKDKKRAAPAAPPSDAAPPAEEPEPKKSRPSGAALRKVPTAVQEAARKARDDAHAAQLTQRKVVDELREELNFQEQRLRVLEEEATAAQHTFDVNHA